MARLSGNIPNGWRWRKKHFNTWYPSSPVLLTGLIGWSLTSGPQQTLASSGVVASGPQDLTAAGTVTHDANGATVVQANPATNYLFHADNAALQLGPGDWSLHGFVRANSGGAFSFHSLLGKGGNPDPATTTDNHTFVTIDEVGNVAVSTAEDGDTNEYPQTVDSLFSPDAFFCLQISYKQSTQTIAFRINGAVAAIATGTVSGTGVLAAPMQTLPGKFWLGTDAYTSGANLSVKGLLLWQHFRTVAEFDWLYNSGAGRTDAEVAAYTG